MHAIITAMFKFFSKKSPESKKLYFTTDIHSHVVPGIDDGSPEVSKSVALVESMKRWGLKRIIATPHVTQDKYENTPEIVAEAFGTLRKGLDDAKVDVDISYSAEYRLDEYFMEQVEGGKLMKMPGGYLLVENSFIQEPWNLDRTLFQLRLAGYKIILAHPERYAYYHDNKKRYEKLHNSGILFQVNLLSFAGYYSKDVKKVAEWLAEHGYVDFLATDLHRFAHVKELDKYIGSKAFQRHRELIEPRLLNDKVFGA